METHRGSLPRRSLLPCAPAAHVVATAAVRKTPPTGTQGLHRGVGLALFLFPRALSKGNTETQGDGAATNHQSCSRATLKRETA